MVRKANSTEAPAQEQPRAPTFDLNDPDLQSIIAQAVAVAMAAKVKEASARDEAKTHKAIVSAFAKAGFKNIVLYDRNKLMPQQPDCTVLTYQRWLELGRKVKAGEHAVRVRGYHLRLFHRDQTEIMTAAERKEAFKQTQEKAARREAKAASAAN